MTEITTFWVKITKVHTLYAYPYIFQLPIHCETVQDPTPNDIPSSVPTQHSSAVVGPETTSPTQLG